MDFNLHKQAVGANEIIFEGMAEQPVDSDVTLPDYCPDILRILKCTITPRVTGVQSAGDRVSIEGNALVRILYVCEESRIHCYEQNYPFSKHIDVKNLTDNSCVSVRPKTDYANCRAVSQRRTDVHGMITMSVKVSKRREDNIIVGADGGGVQLQCKNLETVSTVENVEKPFPMSEVAEVNQSKPSVAQIIRCNAVATIDDVKTINNKILLKGDLMISMLYCSDNSNGEIENFEHTMPISQIIEIDGISETSLINARLIVTSLEIMPKADSAGEMRLLDINARLCAVVYACVQIKIPIVTDAYSTKCEIKTDKRMYDYLRFIENFKDSFVCKDTLDFSGTGVSKMLDHWCEDITCAAIVRNEELVISGSVTIQILYLDKDGQTCCAQRQADYEYKRAMREKINKLRCEPAVIVMADNCNLSGENKVDIKIEFSISAGVFSSDSEKIISDMQLEEGQAVCSKAALTIYFSNTGESIWNIARRYNTTVEAIVHENNLKDEKIAEKGMLLIPGV